MAALLVASPAEGQVAPETDPLQHEVSVTLKLIQVFVSDGKGNPVLGLSKDDFLLYDDGRLMTVTDFEVHHPAPVAEREDEASPRLNRKFFLLLDAYRNDGMGLMKARTTARHFIDTQVLPEDELSLLSYSIERGLVTHVPLTTDHDRVRSAVDRVRLFPGISGTDEEFMAIEEALDFTFEMRDFAVSLRYVPGYKHIILFSAGLPRELLESEDPRLRFEHERMAKELASSSSPIFTVDTQGTRDLAEGREQKGDHALRRLAALTGGRHFANVDYRDDISQDIQKSTGSYYVLGYPVDETHDGSYHEIRVEVRRKGVRVQAQKGYYSPKAFRRYTRVEKRFHLLDLARSASPPPGLPEKMPSVAGIWPDSGVPAVLLLTEIVPSVFEDILADKAEFITLVFDDEGVLRAEGERDLDLTKDPPRRVCLYGSSAPPPGTYDVISVLRNKRTGAAAKASRTVVVPENMDSLSGPVLFVSGEDSQCLLAAIKPAEETETASRLGLEDVSPRLGKPVSPFVHELSPGTPALYAVFGFGTPARDESLPDCVAHLVSGMTSQITPLDSTWRTDVRTALDGTRVLELKLPALRPGEYSLEISLSGAILPADRAFIRKVLVR